MASIQEKIYTHLTPVRVGFIGLGVMGFPMAGHLAAAGHHVTVYNRSAQKAQAWVAEFGGEMGLSPRDAARDAQIVFCCVGNDEDLRSVTLGEQGAFAGMTQHALFVDHTTTSAAVARELGVEAAARGLSFLDAPVSGGQVGAINGQLTVMVGGTPADVERARPIALAHARAFTRMGDCGSGQLAKMVNQICVAGLLQGLAEGVAFGKRAGLDMTVVLEAISKGAAQSWQMENRGPTMIEGRFDFGFAVNLMRKDLALCLDEARRNAAKLPVTALIDQFFSDVQGRGGQRLDISSLITRLVDDDAQQTVHAAKTMA
jgi:3-hydroxyisobutyrate dehydrogenase-like beta-hydroxyacid dehydrogenase